MVINPLFFAKRPKKPIQYMDEYAVAETPLMYGDCGPRFIPFKRTPTPLEKFRELLFKKLNGYKVSYRHLKRLQRQVKRDKNRLIKLTSEKYYYDD